MVTSKDFKSLIDWCAQPSEASRFTNVVGACLVANFMTRNSIQDKPRSSALGMDTWVPVPRQARRLTTCSTEPGGHLAVRCLAEYQAEPADSPAMDGLGDEDVPSAGWLRVTSGDPQTSPRASRRDDEAAAFLVSLRAGP